MAERPELGRPAIVDDPALAVSAITDGCVLLVGGWGGTGVPDRLVTAAARSGVTGLTIVSNNCGLGRPGDVGELFAAGAVVRAVTTFPVHTAATAFRERLHAGEVEVELVPQGTLAERLRAAGAGLGGFYTPAGAGTEVAEGRETRVLAGVAQLFELPLAGDVALIRAATADICGNLMFHRASRGFNPLMAMAAARTIVQADRLVSAGAIDPDSIHLPGVFVDVVLAPETGARP